LLCTEPVLLLLLYLLYYGYQFITIQLAVILKRETAAFNKFKAVYFLLNFFLFISLALFLYYFINIYFFFMLLSTELISACLLFIINRRLNKNNKQNDIKDLYIKIIFPYLWRVQTFLIVIIIIAATVYQISA